MKNKLINEITKYAQGMNCQADVFEWIEKHLTGHLAKNNSEQGEIEHIIDYLASDKRPKRLSKMSYEQAKTNGEKWLKVLAKKGKDIKEVEGDVEVIKDFGDGFRIVKLIGESAYKREGFLMAHCVASYYGSSKEIYSLRDSKNMPHCTMEKDQQIKGKGNGSISPKYIGYVVAFLEEVGMSVGDSEMKNLGYINVEKIKTKLHQTENKFFNNKYLFQQAQWLDLEGEEYSDLDIFDYKELISETKSSSLEFNLKINFNLSVFLKKSITHFFSSTKEISSGNYSQNASSGNYSQNASSGDDSQNASSGDRSQNASSGNYSQNASSGDRSQNASSGNYSQNASSGDRSQNASSGDDSQNASSGNYSKNASSGYGSKNASSGDDSQNASSGNYSQNASSGDDSRNASSGNYSRNASSGDRSKNASSGYGSKNASSGKNSVLMACHHESQVKGSNGTLIALVLHKKEGDFLIPKKITTGEIGKNGLKENVWYKLDDNGNFIESGDKD